MKRFGRKGSLKDILFSKGVLVVLIVLSVLLGISVYERYQVEREMAGRLDGIDEERERLEERKAALDERVDYLRGESGIESEIRKHFDVAKEGEQVVIIVDDEEPVTDTAAAVEAIPEDTRPWYRFW